MRKGDLVAEADVHLVKAQGLGACLPLADAYMLDDVRDALRAGDVKRASQLTSRLYSLTPVEA